MLNNNQLKAVMANDRFIFLLAGAGTGKTTVIENRVKRLIKEGHNKILLISFTKKSAESLRKRIQTEDKNVVTSTFHGFCYQALKDIYQLEIVTEEQLLVSGFTNHEIKEIDCFKRNNKNNDLVKKYNKYLKENNLLDFTDLEILMLKKMKSDSLFSRRIKSSFDYVFIDEFQDTSEIQYELIKTLKTNNNAFFCVGDPDQSIYSFRGASKKVIDLYIKEFKASLYLLDLNYRSSQEIIRLANNLIKHNINRYGKKLACFIKENGYIDLKYFKNAELKNNYILKEIRILLAKGIKQEEITVLYRNHFVANKLKNCLFETYFERVQFMTIHQAKGLEFKVVFMIGINEGVLPMSQIDIEEERRLMYVGVTRTRRYLYIMVNLEELKPSRFILELFRS
ncbi:MAG: ATP-dependent helicase [Acholeplasmataceae bacterium]|nr:ATP-dependent helicase [Acholeplasmataceae bacterium]